MLIADRSGAGPSLMQSLYGDLARQFSLEGRKSEPRALDLLCRLLHHRFLPIVIYRLSSCGARHNVPILPQLLTYLNVLFFGIEIAPRCEIGSGVFFPHTSGTVIGAWKIGRNVTIFQGVTLGARELDMTFDRELRPEIGDNVVLGAGCKVLGGVLVGANSTVGANAVVLHNIAANMTAVGIPAVPSPRQAEGQI